MHARVSKWGKHTLLVGIMFMCVQHVIDVACVVDAVICVVCRYHLFGETGTLAMLMESSGVPDRLHMSDACYQRIMARQSERRRKMVSNA